MDVKSRGVSPHRLESCQLQGTVLFWAAWSDEAPALDKAPQPQSLQLHSMPSAPPIPLVILSFPQHRQGVWEPPFSFPSCTGSQLS